jgi:hypothetical protein
MWLTTPREKVAIAAAESPGPPGKDDYSSGDDLVPFFQLTPSV